MAPRLPLPDDPLVALALRLTDGESIDWKAESESGSVEPSLLHILKQIEAVARAHEGVEAPIQGEKLVAPSNARRPLWGHLEIIELIGSGSYGDVYRARDTRLGRDVALKLLRTRDALEWESKSLIREGHLLSRVRHPNVVTVYGADCIDGRTGVWMELIEGETLEQEVQRRGTFPPDEVAQIGAVLSDALEAVHSAGLLHRDVKTQNVMRERAGRLVLMDFGSGFDVQRFAGGTVEGTPLYAAPEVLNGAEPSVQSDIYSLGVSLWYLLTVSYPVNGRSVDEIRHAHALGQTARLEEARWAGTVARVAAECLSLDPGQRPPTAGDLGRRLRGCVDSSRWYRRFIRSWIVLGFSSAFVLLSGLALYSSLNSTTGSLNPPAVPVPVAGSIHGRPRFPLLRQDRAASDGLRPSTGPYSADAESDPARVNEIVRIDEAFRIAKVKNDVDTLERILSSDFLGMNQNANRRDKKQALELFRSWRIDSLVVERATIRFNTGNTATVTGEQTETTPVLTEGVIFTRVYIQSADGWQLLSSTQFRNPKYYRR